MKNKIKIAACVMFAGLGFSSCNMDLLPLNEVVLENYWTEGEDVQSVVNSCYNAMMGQSYIESIIVWGECRSDNTTPNSTASKSLRDLMKGNLKTTNGWCSWSPFYTVINRCNTVLHYAGDVAAKDPNYTESEYKITQAEVKFMRAYSYLTLIKTFKDVPFTFDASIDDTQDYRIGQTPFETILDSLITDIEGCKDFSPVKYSTGLHNTAKITRLAMYSLLAELYLWRASDINASVSDQQADYRKCIGYCDFVINEKIAQFKEGYYMDKYDRKIELDNLVDRSHVYTTFGLPLLKEENSTSGSSTGPLAYNDIFTEGNSYESIFEITYVDGQDVNYAVGNMYGGYASSDATSASRVILADDNIITKTPTSTTYDNDVLFGVTSDYRSIENFFYSDGSGSQSIYKYVLTLNQAGSTVNTNYGKVGSSSSNYTLPKTDQTINGLRSKTYQNENWILYRLAEVILFRAEAEIALAGTITGNSDSSPATPTASFTGYHNGADLSSAGDLYADAFNLIKAINWRSNPSATTETSTLLPQIANFTLYSDYVNLLMQERRRELMFEGKRYFDLVRQARRVGNTNNFRAALTSKYGEASKAILIKMSNLDFMYMPVLKSQIRLNPNLEQNPCYNDEEESTKN